MVALEKAGANAIKAQRLRVRLPFRANVGPDESEGCPDGWKIAWLLAGLLAMGGRRLDKSYLFIFPKAPGKTKYPAKDVLS